MTDYIPVIRGELVRQQKIDELMHTLQGQSHQLQKEQARSERYFALIQEFARLPLFDLDRLEVLIDYAKDMVAEE